MPELPADGVGVSESQLDWTIWSVTEDVALDGTCSKRKRAFLKTALPRLLHILEKTLALPIPGQPRGTSPVVFVAGKTWLITSWN